MLRSQTKELSELTQMIRKTKNNLAKKPPYSRNSKVHSTTNAVRKENTPDRKIDRLQYLMSKIIMNENSTQDTPKPSSFNHMKELTNSIVLDISKHQ